jgi:hypothetical protein
MKDIKKYGEDDIYKDEPGLDPNLERPRRPQGYDGHFAPFYHEFGTYSVE